MKLLVFGVITGMNLGLMIGEMIWNGGRYSMTFIYVQLAIALIKMPFDGKQNETTK